MKQPLFAWLKIFRLQFYPMTFIAYSVGASIAYNFYGIFSFWIFSIGYVIVFLIELSAVLTNEYNDYNTDKINKNASMFTGGSQVLVQDLLTFGQVKKAIYIVLGLIFIFMLLLIGLADKDAVLPIIFLVLVGTFLAVGYTVPPIKFSYRGLGEIVVGITHSVFVIVCGYAFQTGILMNIWPYLISVPLFLAVFGAIMLASVPDYEADMLAHKKTIAVILYPPLTAELSIAFIVSAAISYFLFWRFNVLSCSFMGKILILIGIHAVVLVAAIIRFVMANNYNRKINFILQLALSYIMWFGVVPLICFLNTSPR